MVYARGAVTTSRRFDQRAARHATSSPGRPAATGTTSPVAFGGDGTLNEPRKGWAGRRNVHLPPGGATNVFCPTIGNPTDVVDTTEDLRRMAHAFERRRIDVRHMNQRFHLASGAVSSASVVERVDRHRDSRRGGEWQLHRRGLGTSTRRFLWTRRVRVRRRP